MVMEHFDEDGHVCTRHNANLDAILTLATIGARVSSFNHDIASKLQGVMMAIDEITEYAEQDPNPNIRRAAGDAMAALKEASALLTTNRALTRTSTKTKAALRDVVSAAADRVGVSVRGAIPDGQIEAVVPLLSQALAVAFDALAGTGRNRSLDAATTDGALVVSSTAEPAATLGDALALASHMVTRAGGELRCGRDAKLIVKLPLAAAP